MAETDFEKWLRLGLGRAILFLKQTDSTPYREAILYACQHDQRYDRQIDESRDAYLYDLIEASGEPEFYRDRIVSALFSFPEDGEEPWQWMGIIRRFALDGDGSSRKVLYRAFEFNARRHDYRGCGEMILLDGVSGLKTVLETYLEQEGLDVEVDQIEYWASYLEEREGKERAREQLRELASAIPKLAGWIEKVEAAFDEYERKRLLPKKKREVLEYPELARQIDAFCEKTRREGKRGFAASFRTLGTLATEKALHTFAAELENETDTVRLLPLLRLFDLRPFPGNVEHLIALGNHTDDRIAHAALQALRNVAHPSVRAFALRSLTDADASRYGKAVDLLAMNFMEGDYVRIEPLLEREMNDDHYHWLGMGVRHLVEKHPLPEAITCLLTLYENKPCGHCRGWTVELLDQLGALPDALREECRYDAYPGTREWIAERKVEPEKQS